MNWDKAKRRDQIGRRQHGITPRQAKFLAKLQRELKWPYSGNGLTAEEASAAIAQAKQELDKRRLPLRHQ